MRSTRLVGLLLVAAGAVGCADGGSSPSQPSPGDGVTPSAAGGPAPFQARPVLAVQGRDLDAAGLEPGLVRRLESLDCLRKAPTANAPTAEAMLACDTRGAGFLLGPAGVDGGVQRAEVVEVRGGYAVQVGLDQASADALGDLVPIHSEVFARHRPLVVVHDINGGSFDEFEELAFVKER